MEGIKSMRKMEIPVCFFALSMMFLFLFVRPPRIHAQMTGGLEPDRPPGPFLNVSSSYQPESHVQGGGGFAASSYSVSAGSAFPINNAVILNLGFSYNLDDYRFSGLSGFAVQDPWGQVNRVSFSTGVMYRPSSTWSFFASPVAQYAGESGADFGDSLAYGVTVGALYRPSRAFAIGFGGGVFRRMDGTSFFPALMFSWNITDKLRLGNSFMTGPSGPAGLELAYRIDGDWETALGGGFRSYRFRLDKNGQVPGGIGEVDSWPVFVRLSRNLGQNLRVHLYGGVGFANELRLEDSRGHEIDHTSYNASPVVGMSMSMRY
jgi:hypothetical protein